MAQDADQPDGAVPETDEDAIEPDEDAFEMAADDVVLYRHVGCPYCERVVRVMDAHGVDYRSRFVVPTHSGRDHVKRISGRRSVPVLVDRAAGVTMAESANIVEHVERTYGGA